MPSSFCAALSVVEYYLQQRFIAPMSTTSKRFGLGSPCKGWRMRMFTARDEADDLMKTLVWLWMKRTAGAVDDRFGRRYRAVSSQLTA